MRFVITGWGVISPIGIGIEAFAEGIREGRSGKKAAASGDTSIEACTIPDFDVAKILGTKKGTRVLDRTAALAVASTSMAIKHSGVSATPDYEDAFGLVLGTSNGSFSRTVEYTAETWHPEKPYMVSPEAFPNTVMNFAAGQCSIAHRLRALNTTISGGRLAGILALRYALRMLRLGYARGVVVGSIEEFSEQMASAARFTAESRGEAPPVLGEGAGMFVVESAEESAKAGRTAHAEIAACEASFSGAPEDSPQAEELASCIRRALDRAGISPSDVWAISSRASGLRRLDAIEDRGLALALGGHAPRARVDVARHVGECFSASASLQLAGLLALFSNSPGASSRVGLVTSVAHGGGVGCAVVRST